MSRDVTCLCELLSEGAGMLMAVGDCAGEVVTPKRAVLAKEMADRMIKAVSAAVHGQPITED